MSFRDYKWLDIGEELKRSYNLLMATQYCTHGTHTGTLNFILKIIINWDEAMPSMI